MSKNLFCDLGPDGSCLPPSATIGSAGMNMFEDIVLFGVAVWLMRVLLSFTLDMSKKSLIWEDSFAGVEWSVSCEWLNFNRVDSGVGENANWITRRLYLIFLYVAVLQL